MNDLINGVTADGVMHFSHVHDIRQVWPIVRPGIEEIISTNHEPFIPEDVFHAIASGHAAMYMVTKGGHEYAGFAVLAPHHFPFMPPALNLWLGYTKEPSTGHYGIEIAKMVLANSPYERLVFCTPQDKWPERYATKLHTWYEVN
ncbi:hypothetical protein FHW69_001594 [Luteibacter sp. Sphag1AF]|uniref:hypothetical protein n=1 Tax=Luteibacter sp. Sphag1AF TaxID=2587031 RepID=UPI00160993E3|nr:hypothetical protein [Luteibacter sp. Sphag1AF]MBB3226993.1 hypothetical protein [Luteibacter sp. Sphag1AF]